jgi:hypothetical protein
MSLHQEFAPADIAARVNARYGDCAINATGDEYQPSAHLNIATAFGYTHEELKAIPDRANLGLSCGNPFAMANLKEVSLRNACKTLPIREKAFLLYNSILGRSGYRFWKRWWVRCVRCGAKDRSSGEGYWCGYEPSPSMALPRRRWWV